jgi:hypothetical protein
MDELSFIIGSKTETVKQGTKYLSDITTLCELLNKYRRHI